MTAILTTLGAAHVTQRNQGAFTTNAFNGLVFDQSNATPGSADTLAVLTQRLGFVVRVAEGYPKKNDTDGRNSGRGADSWTWRFERQAGEPFVASNVAVTNYSGGALVEGAPLAIHAKQTIAQRFDERLIVWLNVSPSNQVTVFTATEFAHQNRVQRVVGFTANTRAVQSAPGGSVVDTATVHTRVAPGQSVWTAAMVLGRDGFPLLPTDVVDFTLTEERFVASSGDWEPFVTDTDVDCARSVMGSVQLGDTRWNVEGGYNVAHTRLAPPASKEGTFRLTYRMTLCDDDVREWRNIVEVRA